MDKKAVVIGSGFGGLATAIRLQNQGYKTTVVEKRDLPGGRAYVFKDNGFTFDAGPTVVTAPDCVRELYDISGRSMEKYLELLPITPLYRLHWENGYTFDYTNDHQDTLKQISRKNALDGVRYDDFLKYTNEVFEEGYVKLAAVPFLNWWSMIRVSPELLRLEAYKTVYQIVSKYIQDEQLRQAFSFHSLLVGGNPFTCSAIYTLIHSLERKWGVFFPRGGTGALVQALVKLLEDQGGSLLCNAEVDEILTQEGKVKGVKLVDGRVIDAELVVSNAEVHHTYHKLLRQEPSVTKMRRHLDKSRYSMSLFLIYFGTKRKFSELAHHNVIFGARYKELLKDIFTRGVLADDFSLYVHKPTITDPSLAPEGCEAFYALSPVPHLGKGNIDWKTEGPKYADRILSYLDERYLPGLKKEIITQRIFTPLDFESELNSHLGSAFSLEPVLTQSAFFRVHNRDENIKGLYFAGAGTHPGAGLPGVIASAKATAELIRSDNLVEVRTRSIIEKTPEESQALESCERMIAVGSKSFSMAAKLFEPETRQGAFFLYGWCRHTDDAIDSCPDKATQLQRLNELSEKTRLAFLGQGKEPVFVAMGYLARKYGIPSYYALELLEGMKMDTEKATYENLEELSLYCYRVAGCVGLMMVSVMGVNTPDALKNASNMGIAMQMTNIARDIMDDFALGRVYIPKDWLKELGMTPEDVGKKEFRPAVAHLVRRLLGVADSLYESGREGLTYLPWRAALAVAVAMKVYSEIGRQVLARGSHAWDTRTVVSKPRKFVCLLEGLWLVAKTVPARLVRPWKETEVTSIWRHQWNTLEHS